VVHRKGRERGVKGRGGRGGAVVLGGAGGGVGWGVELMSRAA